MSEVNKQDLSTPEGVKSFMSESTSEDMWDDRCDAVKAANNDNYPSFWYATIVTSGTASATAKKWNGNAGITISAFAL